MIHFGECLVDGVPVEVARRRARRISIRMKDDGTVAVTVPKWGATLREAEAFLRSKWQWVMEHRAAVLARPRQDATPPSADELAALRSLLAELTSQWAARLSEDGVTWTMRAMKTLWGSCHIVRRRITYNTELARVPRELVEYVVVHELTHLKVASHGPKFYRLMDARLPGWQHLRRRLNKREFAPIPPAVPSAPPPPPAPSAADVPRRVVQCEFDFDFL